MLRLQTEPVPEVFQKRRTGLVLSTYDGISPRLIGLSDSLVEILFIFLFLHFQNPLLELLFLSIGARSFSCVLSKEQRVTSPAKAVPKKHNSHRSSIPAGRGRG